jgi:DNA polymerase-3 subunit gamma/tau
MAYQVIALKFRPQKFDEVVGQKHISETLQNAISSGRIAHAYIFSGPRGVGKTTTARIFAKALNCEQGPTPNPCNSCKNCQEITRGNNLDVIEIDGASNRGIDEIRNLRDNIRFAPVSGRYKIYIIDEVHMLTKESFNALLKTLEEPPPHAIFIFATTEIHKVPQTILSRCQRYDFKSIPVREIVAQLDYICKSEGLDVDEDALLEIAKKADGAMRDAQSLLDQVISFSGGHVGLKEVRDALGLINRDLFFSASTLIAADDKKSLITFVREVLESGVDVAEFLSGLEEHFRNILVAKIIGNADELEVSEEYRKRYMREINKFSQGDILPYIRLIQETQILVRKSAQPKLKFELLLLKMAEMPTAASLGALLTEMKKKSNSGSLKNTPVGNKPNSSGNSFNPVSQPMPQVRDGAADIDPPVSESEKFSPPDLKKVLEIWQKAVRELNNMRKSLLANQMALCRPLRIKENGIIEVGYARGNNFAANHLQKNMEHIIPFLQDLFKRRVKIDFVETEFPEDNGPKPVVSSSLRFEELLEKEKMLKEMVDEFDLKLIRIEEKKREN